MKAKKTVRTICSICSTVFLIVAIALCALVFITNSICAKSGEEPFYLGYRPCLIQTGSMEPYMMTNGIIMTKKVDSIEELAVGDVVTYRATNGSGKTIYITHRIIEISADGLVTTKGDNNNVADSYQLTMENIIAKEVGVFNQPSVWLIKTWNNGATGKVFIVAIVLCILCLFYAGSTLLSAWLNEEEISANSVAEYSKICRKLGLVPAVAFANETERLSTLLEEQGSTELSEGSAETTPTTEPHQGYEHHETPELESAEDVKSD